MADRSRRFWPKLADPQTDFAFRLIYNAVYDAQDAFSALVAQATLHATIAGGAVTAVHVISAGNYAKVPTVTAVGGGGSGAKFTPVLQNGGILSVNINSGGSGYTSPPYLQVTGS